MRKNKTSEITATQRAERITNVTLGELVLPAINLYCHGIYLIQNVKTRFPRRSEVV